MILLVSFLETWRELGLVHSMVKNQLLVHTWGLQHSVVHTARALVVSSSFWVFLCFYNTLCRIDKEGYVEKPSESLPFLTELGLRICFFPLRGTGKYRRNRESGRKSKSVL